MELQKENWLVEKDHGYHFLAIPHLKWEWHMQTIPETVGNQSVGSKQGQCSTDHKVYICVSLSHSIYKHIYGAFKNTSVETETTEWRRNESSWGLKNSVIPIFLWSSLQLDLTWYFKITHQNAYSTSLKLLTYLVSTFLLWERSNYVEIWQGVRGWGMCLSIPLRIICTLWECWSKDVQQQEFRALASSSNSITNLLIQTH